MLAMIDFRLLQWLEKAAQQWQRLTGKNCFWLAKVAAVCHGFIIIVGMVPSVMFITKRPAIATASGIMIVLAFCLTFRFFVVIRHKERIVLNSQESNLSNQFKVEDYDRRVTILFVILSCFFIIVLNLIIGYFLLYFSISLAILMFWQGLLYYFSACDPLPPAKSKIKEWKEKLVSAVKGVFAPVPQPSPTHCE